MRKVLTVVLLLFFIATSAEAKLVKVGVIAYRGTEKAQQQWTATISYIQNKLPQYEFTLIPLSLEQMKQAVLHDDLEFTIGNPGFYFYMKQFGLQPLASLISRRDGIASDQFGAIIFTRSNRGDINELEDLKGKSFAAVSQLAFGGFQMAWREFKNMGIDPMKDFSPMAFIGFPQDSVVFAVRDGKYDAGTVRTDMLESLINEGKIERKNFKILNQREVKGFPFLLSTRLYPNWLFSRSITADEKLVTKVREILRSIQADSEAAIKGNYIGWTGEKRMDELLLMDFGKLLDVTVKDDKYKGVDGMMKELNIGPYQLNK